MATTFYPANLQWFGIAKETTYGTPVAAPTIWIPVKSPKWDPQIAQNKDDALRGSMGKTFEQVPDMRYSKVTYQTFPYMDSVYPHFLALLGTPDTVAGSADPYTHKTALYNGSGTNAAQPPSYTLFYADATGQVRQIPGAIAGSLKLAVKAGALVGVDVEWVGLFGAAITAPTNTPTALSPWPSWNSTITLGGVAATNYSDITLTYKRATEPIPTITGTQDPYAIFGGEVDVTGDLTAVFPGESAGDLADFIAGTQPVLIVKTAPAGDATHSLQLTHSKVAYETSAPEGTNKWMEIKSKVECLTNPTDGLSGQSPVQVVFTTATSTAF